MFELQMFGVEIEGIDEDILAESVKPKNPQK